MGLYIIIMGVQGAGKGVQAQFISATYNIPHVSTGDLFRAMKTRTDDFARKVQDIMASGRLVSDDDTNKMVEERLAQDDAQNGVILDGYPRNEIQADFLSDLLAKKGEGVSAVLLLELDLYTAFKRAFGRVTGADGQSYNIYTNNDDLKIDTVKHPDGKFPPRIDVSLESTGVTLKRRPDDANAVAVIKRIDTYLETTQPLIEYYETKGLLQRINAGQSIEAVSREIQSIIERVSQ